MKRFIYVVIAVCLMNIVVGCKDELIASAEDRNFDLIEINEEERIDVSDTINSDTIKNEEVVGTPITIGVNVVDWKDFE